jgi:hypothetical protein
MMNTTTHGIPETHSRRHGTDYSRVWQALNSPVYRVLDEDGNNPSEGKVRHLLGNHWLYVDEMDGFQLMEESAVDHLILDAE